MPTIRRLSTPPIHESMDLMGPSTRLFGQDAIDRAIDHAASRLGEGQSGVVVHLDLGGELSASVVERIGDHVKITGAAVLDTSQGLKFDRQHLAVAGELIVTF